MRAFLERAALAALLAVGPAAASAQQPSAPPPPAGGEGERGPEVHELLPDIGRIGAQVGVMAGASWNPYDVGQGFQLAGYVDLPLSRAPGGKLSYEIVIGLSHADSDPFTITNPLAYVANLAAGASPDDALAGPPAAPFPVVRSVRTRLRLLEVSPFGLKYTIRKLDHVRLRPYAAAGLDFTVVITEQTPLADESLVFTGTAPFDDPLIAGIVAQAAELEERGTPSGQGNIELGWHAGGGLEIRIARGLSLNLDYRFAHAGGDNGSLHARERRPWIPLVARRRALLKAAAWAPLAALAPRAALARDYTAPAEVFDAIDGLEAEVGARLRALRAALASAAPVRRQRPRRPRAAPRRARAAEAAAGSAARPPPPPTPAAAADLEGLRAAQEALVYAHAEGLPAVAEPFVVDALARHMVDLSRHLAVTQLWIEAES